MPGTVFIFLTVDRTTRSAELGRVPEAIRAPATPTHCTGILPNENSQAGQRSQRAMLDEMHVDAKPTGDKLDRVRKALAALRDDEIGGRATCGPA